MLPNRREWIKIIKEAVINSEKVLENGIEVATKRANNFSYIEFVTELGSANHMAEGFNEDYFWDRSHDGGIKKAVVTYPSVSLYERTKEIDEPFINISSYKLNTRLFVIDHMNPSKIGASKGRGHRHYFDVIEDVSEILFGILNYITGIKKYTYLLGGKNQESWHNESYAKWMELENKISNLVEIDNGRDAIISLKRFNKDSLIRSIRDESTNALYGVQIDLNLPTDYCLSRKGAAFTFTKSC